MSIGHSTSTATLRVRMVRRRECVPGYPACSIREGGETKGDDDVKPLAGELGMRYRGCLGSMVPPEPQRLVSTTPRTNAGRGGRTKKTRRERKWASWDAHGFYTRWAWAKTFAKPKRIFWERSKLGPATSWASALGGSQGHRVTVSRVNRPKYP